jgi:hypothetical protein
LSNPNDETQCVEPEEGATAEAQDAPEKPETGEEVAAGE